MKTIEPLNKHSLFLVRSLSNHCANKKHDALKKIEGLTQASIEGISEQVMVKKLYDEFKVEAPKIADLSSCCNPIDSTDKKVIYHIPFTGNGKLFDLLPSTFGSLEPYGHIKSNEIMIEYPLLDGIKVIDDTVITYSFNENYNRIAKYLKTTSADCEKFNQSLTEMLDANVREQYRTLNKIKDTINKLKKEAN